MKDFKIDIAIAGRDGTTAYAARSTGTLSDRPLVNQCIRGLQPSEAPFRALLDCLKDLHGFLNPGDHIEAYLYYDSADPQAWILRGSGNPDLDLNVRTAIADLFRKGVSVFLLPADKGEESLVRKASMSLALGI